MDRVRAVFSLGSNLGDRRSYLESALWKMEKEMFHCPPVEISPVVETEAFGFSAPPFLNQVVVFETAIPPLELLMGCKRIEEQLGRSDTPEYDSSGRRKYHSRTIDIDILLYGDMVLDHPQLKIPHPQISERPFVRELMDSLRPNQVK